MVEKLMELEISMQEIKATLPIEQAETLTKLLIIFKESFADIPSDMSGMTTFMITH